MEIWKNVQGLYIILAWCKNFKFSGGWRESRQPTADATAEKLPAPEVT